MPIESIILSIYLLIGLAIYIAMVVYDIKRNQGKVPYDAMDDSVLALMPTIVLWFSYIALYVYMTWESNKQ